MALLSGVNMMLLQELRGCFAEHEVYISTKVGDHG